MYAGTNDQVLNGTGRETFEAVALLQSIQKTPYQPAGGASYPKGRFGDSMRQIAQLIKADVGVEVAFADIGGWDHHVNEVGAKASVGQLPNVLRDFGESLAAFYQDLGDRMEDVVVVTMSEFGRTAKENGNRGTDHGHANAMFVMGGPVQRRQSVRQMAGSRARAAQRTARPCPHHRFPRCAWRSRLRASRQPVNTVGFPRLRRRRGEVQGISESLIHSRNAFCMAGSPCRDAARGYRGAEVPRYDLSRKHPDACAAKARRRDD